MTANAEPLEARRSLAASASVDSHVLSQNCCFRCGEEFHGDQPVMAGLVLLGREHNTDGIPILVCAACFDDREEEVRQPSVGEMASSPRRRGELDAVELGGGGLGSVGEA
ncbi:hypothetical protein [Streptomyces gobiensis]|uniref:hypothetical protein n=1 Tax=Streptomyces gobiensis TaxID=2875706 RepID=UPI001E32864B|nr:hypothetical protein [Streptomyces gobiensis]UGY91157.1 hypothetical protein test1122_05075 [Streptomyces gobiensis]